MERQTVFQINDNDNVATALCGLTKGEAAVLGEGKVRRIMVAEPIPDGHKVALTDLEPGDGIVKYGVVIGCATKHIPQGTWVHLHCMRSLYDERSGHLNVITGEPEDISYE